MKLLPIILVFISQLAFCQSKYEKDFDEFWKIINGNYAYFHQQGVDWQKVKEVYKPIAANIQHDTSFIRFLENLLFELHNGHVSLNTNLKNSNRLIPSGADLFIERINNQFIITDVRRNSGAELVGLRPGMVAVKFNEQEIPAQLNHFLPRYTKVHNPSMIQYAVSMLFAGTHNKPRNIAIMENGKEKNYYPDSDPRIHPVNLLEYKFLDVKTGYIKIINSLGDNNLIGEFDKALDSLMQSKTLVIDLSETPGGGNTTVARAIMGRFIKRKLPYQQHEYDEFPYDTRRHWVEYVLPRKTQYTGKLYIIVGHWTGSMGEGIAIGFDGLKRGTVIGTRMAGLIGAISNFRLTETGIGFQFPVERLYHINGMARENYKPAILTRNIYHTWQELNRILKIKNIDQETLYNK